MKAEFEEKQFEMAANHELALGQTGNRVFSSGQMLENIVGYDAAADPESEHMIWNLLGRPRPKGLVLLPEYWMPGQQPSSVSLPRSTVSLIVQFKRPEYLRGARAAQWNLWGTPYYRFHREANQHRILRRLEQKLSEDAVVRYAAPAFWALGQLEAAQLSRSVLTKTGFVSPSEIGTHKVWTYIGPGQNGRANPYSRPIAFQTYEDLIVTLERTRRVSRLEIANLDTRLRPLATALQYRNPRVRDIANAWVGWFTESQLALSSEQLLRLSEYATIQSVMRMINAHWYLIGS